MKYLHLALTITNKKTFLEKVTFFDGVPDYERISPDVDKKQQCKEYIRVDILFQLRTKHQSIMLPMPFKLLRLEFNK